MKHYLQRLTAKIPDFETMEERDLNYIKVGLRTGSGWPTEPNLPMFADDRRRRQVYHKQSHFRLSFPQNRVLSPESPYQVKAHIFR